MAKCPECGKDIDIENVEPGKTTKCPGCSKKFEVIKEGKPLVILRKAVCAPPNLLILFSLTRISHMTSSFCIAITREKYI